MRDKIIFLEINFVEVLLAEMYLFILTLLLEEHLMRNMLANLFSLLLERLMRNLFENLKALPLLRFRKSLCIILQDLWWENQILIQTKKELFQSK